jgi:hypothetical protein
MLKVSGKNVVKKGEVIFGKGEEITQIGIILSGKVVVQGEYVKMIRSQGTYLALNGYSNQTYHATYTALDDSVIYALPTQGEQTIRNIVSKNADYRAIMVSSQFRIAVEIYRLKSSLIERAERLCSFVQGSYTEYKNICKTFEVPAIGIEELRELIRSFPAKGITVILSSHILSEVQQIADHIGIIAGGVLGYEGKLNANENLEQLFMDVVKSNHREG